MQDLILIIDFMNYVHRCRVGKLTGEYVLIYNFFRNLRATIEQFKPNKIFFALEGRPKHRYELYADYKSNRIIKNASSQIKIDRVLSLSNDIQKLLLLLPVTLVSHRDFEADDIIHTLCKNMNNENIIIISSDSDYIQILQEGYENCKLYNPISKEFIIAPQYPYLAFKALVGDKSDNIPSILKSEKALDIICSPRKFKNFLSIEENRANFNINRRLIEFKSIPEDEIEIVEGYANFSVLKNQFSKMKFESIIRGWNNFVATFKYLKF